MRPQLGWTGFATVEYRLAYTVEALTSTAIDANENCFKTEFGGGRVTYGQYEIDC